MNTNQNTNHLTQVPARTASEDAKEVLANIQVMRRDNARMGMATTLSPRQHILSNLIESSFARMEDLAAERHALITMLEASIIPPATCIPMAEECFATLGTFETLISSLFLELRGLLAEMSVASGTKAGPRG